MNKLLCLFLLFLVAVGFNHSVEKKTYKDGLDFEEKLSANEVFLKRCVDLEFFPSKNVVFFLDRTFSMIFKVELSTGKLLKTISTKGEGPFELKSPICFQVKNNMIFVLDSGLSAVKIFDWDGKGLSEFKFKKWFDDRTKICVNEKNEIFFGKIDIKKNTMVTVYDMKGNELRSLIHYKPGDKLKDMYIDPTNYYFIALDSKENIYVLYYFLRKLAKYTKNGDFVWETPIKNELLDQYPHDDGVKRKNGNIMSLMRVLDIDVTENNEIVVGHGGGGTIFGEDGKLKRQIAVNQLDKDDGKFYFVGINIFNLRDSRLMTCSPKGYVYIYK